jgi:putative ABC transport system permease protein
VFHTVKSRGSREDNPEIVTPFWQEAFPYSAIGVRTAEPPATMARSIAAAVNAVDPQTPLYLARTMEQVRDEGLANDRFTMVLLASFAVIGLLLAAAGIYGVISYLVNRRTHEIGIRVALGAQRSNILIIILSESARLAIGGVLIGVCGAFALTRLLRGVLYGVKPTDPVTFAAVIVFLLGIAVLACYLPAYRATRIDSAAALRHE